MTDSGVRQLKAIMFSDVKSFSAMMAADEERTMRLIKEHREIVRKILARYDGEEHGTAGDSFFVLFASAVNAVRCAIEIQETFHKRNAEQPEEEQIWIRIGIHIGDIIVDAGDNHVYGEGINIAARTEPQAEPGGICITQDVFKQVKNKIDLKVISIGWQEMKNIVDAPELYRIIVGQMGGVAGERIERKGVVPRAAPARGRVVVLQHAHVNVIDPAEVINGEDISVVNHTHEPLIRCDVETGEPEPCLAMSWRKDGSTFFFELRRDVCFHDGSPLTAEETAASLQHALYTNIGRGFLYDIENVEPVSEKVVAIKTKGATGSFFSRLSLWQATISKPSESWPIGTGPFRILSWNSATGAIVLEPNPFYWGTPPRLSRVVFKTVPDDESRRNLLEQGEHILAVESSCEFVDSLESNPTVHKQGTIAKWSVNLSFNTQKKPLDSPKIRRAIAGAIDRKRIVKELYNDHMPVAKGFLPAGVQITRSEIAILEYDPERAKLELSPFISEFRPLKLFLYSERRASTPNPQLAADIICESLTSVGLEVEPVFLRFNSWLEAVTSGQHDLAFGAIGPDYPDPESYYCFFSKEGIKLKGNHSLLEDDEFEALFADARYETNPFQRIEKFQQLESYLCTIFPVVPIASLSALLVVGNKIKNVSIPVEGPYGVLFSLAEAYIEE